MSDSPFAAAGEWLRCSLHGHTTNSDGTLASAEVVAHYAAAGYDVLAITDHWHVTEWAGRELLTIASAELSAHVGAAGEADVLALGVSELPAQREPFPDIESAAAWIAARGGVPVLAHPHWSGLSAADVLDAPSLAGIEAFNGGCELESGSGAAPELWDAVLRRGRACVGIATDDSHEPGRDSLQGWTMVRSAERTAAAVLQALRAGRCYASSGPVIHDLRITDAGLEVHCSPARSVTLRSAPWEGGRANADPALAGWRAEVLERDAGGLIVAARLRFPERSGYGRIEVQGPDGRRAWTNALTVPVDPGGPETNWEPATG